MTILDTRRAIAAASRVRSPHVRNGLFAGAAGAAILCGWMLMPTAAAAQRGGDAVYTEDRLNQLQQTLTMGEEAVKGRMGHLANAGDTEMFGPRNYASAASCR